MRHKVVLYNPRAVFWTMPLALLAVGSALDRHRFKVVIVDGRLQPPEALFEQLEDALCLGMTVLTGAPLGDALAISKTCKERFPDLPIIWGGWHPSLFPVDCMRETEISAVVNGQGEETFVDIVEHLAQNEGLVGIPGCVARDERGEISVGPPRLMADINRFPSHDYDLIPVEHYFNRKGRRQLDYVTSQGCRFRCNFCADPAVFKRGWQGLPPDRIVHELGVLWRRYHFYDLAFQDETYFTQSKRVAAVAEGLLQDALPFSWFATMRADQGRRLDEAILALCKRSGLRTVMIGLEAGAQETIDHIEKDIKIEDMWITAEKLLRHGIGAIINVIVGFPGESPQSVAETLRVAHALRAMSPQFEISIFSFRPYPGNPIATRLQAQNFAFPDSLQAWASFDYLTSESPWLTQAQQNEIEQFKFYQRYAYAQQSLMRWPLRQLSRWRLQSGEYRFPLERRLIEWLRPPQALS